MQNSINDIEIDLEPDTLVLDPNHPGINDKNYNARREFFFNIARNYRLDNKGLPTIEYTEEEHTIWKTISDNLEVAHENHACKIYLDGKHSLGIATKRIPQLKKLDQDLRNHHDMGLVPAEGLIDVKNFFRYLSKRRMPCTQFLRYGKNPQYTPEPDAVHDVIGHIPPLMNEEYANLIQLIGNGVESATDAQLIAWQRIYWFTIEFGLIMEEQDLKVLGAGLLSSFGEIEYCFSDNVVRKSFDLDEVIEQDFDSSIMQNLLYVVPSLKFLTEQIETLIERFNNENNSSSKS